jgi:hypothetical protein
VQATADRRRHVVEVDGGLDDLAQCEIGGVPPDALVLGGTQCELGGVP